MRFNTRSKKPTVYGILALAVPAAILIGILASTGAEAHAAEINIVLDVFFAASIAVLVWAFHGQLQYNPYSYNTIYYAGFSVFLAFVLITHVNLTIHLLRDPLQQNGQNVTRILSLLSVSARSYVLLSWPFILVLSAALCISNITLIRHEGKRFVNILGILLSVMLLGGEVLLTIADAMASKGSLHAGMQLLLVNIFAAIYLYFECMVIGIMVAHAIAASYEPLPDKDYLIVLGCSIRADGSVSPLLRDRIDRALAFRNKQLQQTGKDLIFVTSGGQGSDEVISESEAMKRYLMEKGIAEDHILKEELSTSTFENMKFSKAKIEEKNGKEKSAAANVAFSTTNYHVFRSGLYARRVKMRAVGIGARAKWYFWPNALVREFVGLLTAHRGKQALIITGMIAIYAILAFSVSSAGAI